MNILRPQDIYILLALVAGDDDEWTYDRLAGDLGLSASQIFRSLERAEVGHLFNKKKRRVRVPELCEFITHGIRYAFAATPGRMQRGIPTGWGMPKLSGLMSISGAEVFVWPAPNGTARGQAIEPLHASTLTAVADNEKLYHLLAITDIFRVGSPRERKVAGEELERVL